MNKSELVSAVAGRAGVSQSEADAVIGSLLEVIADRVAADDKVQLPGWLTFERKIRKARTGRNPRTGETIQIPATPAVKVSVGSKLKAAVTG